MNRGFCLPLIILIIVHNRTNIITFADEYSARAMAMRCLCPPDKLNPFGPISVESPSGKSRRSSVNAHAINTFS